MAPGHDDVRRALTGDLLAGLPPTAPWAALLEIGDLAVGVRQADGVLVAVEDVTINASWDFGFRMDSPEWMTAGVTGR